MEILSLHEGHLVIELRVKKTSMSDECEARRENILFLVHQALRLTSYAPVMMARSLDHCGISLIISISTIVSKL